MREKNKKIHIYQTKCPILFIKSQKKKLDCLHSQPNSVKPRRNDSI